MVQVGMMYANGQYVEVDCKKAKEYLIKVSTFMVARKTFWLLVKKND